MKKATCAACGVAAGYLLAPYIKKGINWVKSGLLNLKKKLDEAAKEEEVSEPEEEQPEENPEEKD